MISVGLPEIHASCDDRLAHTVTWSRYRGALYGTLVLKATLALQHGRLATLLPPKAVAWCDTPRASGALDLADESAPFSGGGAVLVRGFVYAREASELEPTLARVVVGTDRPVVDKVVAAIRSGKIPLLWEQALLTHENPAGTPHPVLLDPRDPSRAIGFGPIAASWTPRVELLAAPIGVRDQILELPDRLDPRFFNPAPRDQQCRPFQGSEAIVLTNLSATLPELRTWLPALAVRAKLTVDLAPQQAAFFLDTLSIDAEAATGQVVWRAVVPMPPGARVVAFEVTLDGRFEPPPPVEAAPETQPARETTPPAPETAAPAAPAAPTRAARVTTSAPAQRLRFPDARSALLERMAAGQPLDDLDLEAADLSGLDLSMRSLGRCKLDGANLRGTNLRGANLWSASLVGADLATARLDDADLEEADLTKAAAQKASFVRATLARAKLGKARLDSAVLDDADLSDCAATGVALLGARLRRARANRAKLDRAVLVSADLQDASLDFATLERSSLDEASFDNASLADAELVQCVADQASFVKARLARAKLGKARLDSAVLRGADLTSANLDGADLTKAQLDDALLDYASLRGAKLVGADLTRASLRDCDLGQADLTGARLTDTDRSSANLAGAKLPPAPG